MIFLKIWNVLKDFSGPIIVAAAIVAIFIWNNNSIRDLTSELAAAKQELSALKVERQADERAIITYDTKRSDAEKTAKERLHALEGISPDDSESVVIERCVDGLCAKDAKDASHSPDASGKPPESLRKARETGKSN